MTDLGEVWRAEWGRLLALLAARFRDVDLAEESLAEAFEAAARTWPADGVPADPAAWLHTVARNRALDRLRRAGTARRALPLLVVPPGEPAAEDEELRLLLLTCHPALAPDTQAALALRLVLGLPTEEIARLFLVPTATVAARITRGKRKIARAGLPLAMPADLEGRVEIVLRTLYLCFTAGYAPGDGADVLRADLAGEAIRLGHLFARLLGRRRAGVDALLALMILQHARRDARVGPDGALVLLADQDRARWRRDEIALGLELLARVPAGAAEELRLQAVIAAAHCVAPSDAGTDWPGIARAYAALEALTGSPVVRLNRAVALARVAGPEAGLALLDGLDDVLPSSHRLPAVRGELLARAGRADAARAELGLAVERCGNEAERAHLRARLEGLA